MTFRRLGLLPAGRSVRISIRYGHNRIKSISPRVRKRSIVTLTAVGLFGCGVYFFSARAMTSGEETTEAAPPALYYVPAAEILAHGNPGALSMRSDVALVVDDREGVSLYERRVDEARPIASLTKLMTALVIIESDLPLDEPITITRDDRDRLRGTGSRLPFGGVFTRQDLLLAAIGASDNRAAAALARTYPGGTAAFIAAMNEHAVKLGMTRTRYSDSSGLDSRNVSSASDLVKLTQAVGEHPLLRAMSTTGLFAIVDHRRNARPIALHNTNRLVRGNRWEIGLSKTGYTADAGNCLVMKATIGTRPVTIVLLDSWGKLSKYADAERIRDWLIKTEQRIPRITTAQTTSS